MMWLPYFLSEEHDFSDFEISGAVAAFEFGTLAGALIIGIITDLMKQRRCPVLVLSILIGAGLLLGLQANAKYIFAIGFFIGGASLLVSSVACSDIEK